MACVAWEYLGLPTCHSKGDITGKQHKQEMKNIITGKKYTAHIISWDVLHPRRACQEIITASRDVSGHGAAKVHYKSQPSSMLPHPLLWPSPPWEPGGCEPPSCPPRYPRSHLHGLLSSVLCQISGFLVVKEGSRFRIEGCWACIKIASGLGPSL